MPFSKTTLSFVSLILLGISLILSVHVCYGSPTNYLIVRGSNLNIFVAPNGQIGFQSEQQYVLFTVTSGNWNSSTNSIEVYENNGEIQFSSLENFVLNVTYTVDMVKIKGDQNRGIHPLDSGDSVTIDSGDYVTIFWQDLFEPLLPVLFILGICGIVGTIGSSMYVVEKIKRKDYLEALRFGVIFLTLSIALVLCWLWA